VWSSERRRSDSRNILCEAAGNKVTLTATDLELSIRTSCEAKVKKEGSGTIPRKNSSSWCDCCLKAKSVSSCSKITGCKSWRPENVQDGWDGKGQLPCDSGVPASAGDDSGEILSSLIAKTAFAISNEESRYTLNGALLLLKPDTIAMVATDGHRLAVAETDHKFAGLTREVRPLVPKKALTEVQRLTAEAGEDGQIEFALR